MRVAPLSRAVAASCRRPILVLLLAAALAAIAIGYAATHFRMTSNTTDLIAPDVGWREHEARIKAAFPLLGDVTLVVVDGATPERAEAAAAALAERLRADPRHFSDVRRLDGGRFFARHGLLFGDTEDVRAALASMVEAAPLLRRLAANPTLRGVASAMSLTLSGVENATVPLAKVAPHLGKLADAIDRSVRGETVHFSWQALADGGPPALAPPRRQTILVDAVLDFGALTPGARSSAAIHDAAGALGLDGDSGVSVRLTGGVPLADEEFASLSENMGLIGALMACAMLLTLWLATRSARMVAAIMVTVLAGLAMATAAGLAAVGQLNLISVAFIPLFVGLGVDFGIQLSVRLNAERLAGAGVTEGLERAVSALGYPLALAAAALFLGFAAFLPTAYVGVAELGVIAGIGMVIALALTVTLLPALLTLMRPDAPRREVGFRALAPVDRFLARRRGAVLWTFAAAMLVSVALLPQVRFDFNPLHMRDPQSPAMTTLADLMRDPARTPNTVDILAPDPDAATALAVRLSQLPEVAQAITVDSFVPPDQAAKLELIADARERLDGLVNPVPAPTAGDAETVAALRALVVRLSALSEGRPGPDAEAARRLADALAVAASASPADRDRVSAMLSAPLRVMLDQARAALQAELVTRETLPPDLRRDWVAPDGKARIQVFPRGDSNDNAVLRRFTTAVRALAPQASGMSVSTQEAARTIGGAFVQAGVLALVLVSALLLSVLRNLREVAFTLAPVALSIFLTLGTCVVLDLPINFTNIIAFPLLLGVGTAFHIYFVMAWRAGATDLLQSSLARAVIFSALATGAAFGSLWLSNHPGTASMGEILMISLGWTLVCALIFEPALLGPRPAPGGTERP